MYMELDYRDNILLRCIVKHSVIRQCILVNYSMLMRSIHDFIALTKNNNIVLRTKSALTKNNNIDLRTKSEVDIVIRVQCDKIMSCIDRKQHTTIALLFFNLHY